MTRAPWRLTRPKDKFRTRTKPPAYSYEPSSSRPNPRRHCPKRHDQTSKRCPTGHIFRFASCNTAFFLPTFVIRRPNRRSQQLTKDTPVIEIRNLHKAYGALEVIKGVDITAHRGDVVSLIGSSGSGKSTILRCANLLEDSQQGDILFQGEPVKWKGQGLNRHPSDFNQVLRIRTNLSMVFQQFNLWAHMTILQNVMEAPVTVLGRDRAEVEQAARGYLDKVGIGDKADVYPAQMSGGQQQRAAIARALCMEPEALLFDEPTSALDPELEQEVVRVIKDLAAEGRTMMIVTHDMKMAADVSDQVIFLHQGLIEEQGAPDALFGAPKSERLQQFLSSTMAT